MPRILRAGNLSQRIFVESVYREPCDFIAIAKDLGAHVFHFGRDSHKQPTIY